MFQDNNCNEYYDQNFDSVTYNNDLSFKLFEECKFINCNLNGASFKRCKFRYCQFINCNLSLMSVASCSFLDVFFKDCKIIGVNWSTVDSIWPPIKFSQCNLSQSTFLGMKLKSIIITNCVVRDVDFRECDLEKATLTSNDFKNTLFVHTNLINSNFNDSTNYVINVLENKIKGAAFSLPDAIFLLQGLDIKIT